MAAAFCPNCKTEMEATKAQGGYTGLGVTKAVTDMLTIFRKDLKSGKGAVEVLTCPQCHEVLIRKPGLSTSVS